MPLASAQVIDGIVARLVADGATAGKVFAGRGWSHDESELPAWVVTAQAESIEPQTIHYPALQIHTLNVDAVVKCRAAQDLDDAMPALAVAGINALQGTLARAALTPLVNVGVFVTAINRELIAEGEAAIGALTLSLLVTFNTMQNAPGVLV